MILVSDYPHLAEMALPRGWTAEPLRAIYEGAFVDANGKPILEIVSSWASALPPRSHGWIDWESPPMPAAQAGDAAAREAVQSVLKTAWTARTDGLHGFYGIGDVPNWLGTGQSWAQASPEDKAAERLKWFNTIRPLLEPATGIFPRFYADYPTPDQAQPGADLQPFLDITTSRNRESARICLSASRGRPVMPTTCHRVAGLNDGHLLTPAQYNETQMVPAIEAGCERVILWTAGMQLEPAYTTLDAEVAAIVAALPPLPPVKGQP